MYNVHAGTYIYKTFNGLKNIKKDSYAGTCCMFIDSLICTSEKASIGSSIFFIFREERVQGTVARDFWSGGFHST